mgnify:CR=1 FL=1
MKPELNRASAQQWLKDEIALIYQRLAAGKDVSPAQRLYVEGQVKLLLAFGIIEYPWIKQLVADLYQQYLHSSVSDTFWLWAESEQRFYLPVKMHKAPVYKH